MTEQTLRQLGAPGTTVRPRLPEPVRERWQPLRIGLTNIYRFDDEVFAFEDGRLLLRGNNGTGKSRVLALTVPFLLDGQLRSDRVEPDGDPAKRMEWNLLLGRYPDRLGYTWMEFGRRPANAETDAETDVPTSGPEAPTEEPAEAPAYVTIGCGMRASAGRGAPTTWFFVTDQRVGDDLQLIADSGQALTRDRLIDAVGPRGQVFDNATAYRRAVDRALFGLGERYDALVDLLIQLRRPQLSRQLDEGLLSDALSQALPPIPAAVLADVAEAFRALDADRDALAGYQAALGATETFLTAYGTYGAVASRRRATAVRQATSRYEATRGRLRDAEQRRDAAASQVATLEARLADLEDEHRAAGVEVRTLETSPEMDAARELDAARTRASELAAAAAERAADLEVATEELARRDAELERVGRAVAASRTEVSAADQASASAALTTGLGAVHAASLRGLELPDARDPRSAANARTAIDAEVARTRTAAHHLLALDDVVRVATRAVDRARDQRDERSEDLDRARDAASEADASVAGARAALIADLHDVTADLRELLDLDVGALTEMVEELTSSDGDPIAVAVDMAATAATDRLAVVAADLARQRRDLGDEQAAAAAERAAVAEGRHTPPPAPHTRDPAAREHRVGAPLWRLVDLQDGIGPDEVAGYEAALEASGLLDAWVTPDGSLLDADDTVIIAADGPVDVRGGLARLLTPAVAPDDIAAAAVPAENVARVLATIGVDGAGATPADGGPAAWVAADGRWCVGPLHGRWHKDTAQHLGHVAREAARLRRLDELDRLLATLAARATDLDGRDADLDARRARLAAERRSVPSADPLRQTLFALDRATTDVRRREDRLRAAEEVVRARHDDLDGAVAERAAAAEDLGLPDRAADPAGLLSDLDAYAATLPALWAALTIHGDRLRSQDTATVDRQHSAATEERHRAQARDARQLANDAAIRRDALQEAVGSSVAEVVAALEAARSREVTLQTALGRTRGDREEQLRAREAAGAEASELERQVAEHADARAQDVEGFRRLGVAGFLDVAGIDLDVAVPTEGPWAPDPAVRAARRVNDELDDVRAEREDWERVQRDIYGHFTALEHALLPHAMQPTATVDDGLVVVTTGFQGRDSSMPALRDVLGDEVMHRQTMLDAKEREVLENHLVGEVATQLHELIRQGESLVAGMNDELAERPTSTGMRLRFAWRPREDGPDTLADARRRLLAADHVWSAEDRESLGRFLQARIREVRDADDTGTWQEHLTIALDYRRWHRFAIERQQDGTWVRLTRRTHGTGSGGEKALALTVPQFAAAAAHYRSAGAHAPRLIALDEAFVGIDGDMRAKCLDLLVRFDLDVMMTSEREWGCYPTVPAIAIDQLSTRPGIDAIGVHRWVWNGRDRLEVRTATEPHAQVRDDDAQDGMFPAPDTEVEHGPVTRGAPS